MSYPRRTLAVLQSITPVQFLIVISCLLWMYAFRGFLLGYSTVVYDATSYYEHTKFFVENLMRGVFPLWDPVWYGGSPNSFFLRRIGAYNPMYALVAFFKMTGLSFVSSYILFMQIYFLSGMVAFYLLAKKLFKDEWVAFAAFLLLLFSALGTRMFDSYLHLVFVPLIWFFYFLVSFALRPQRSCFLGLVLSMMVLLTTYIPFFFIVIVMTFFFSFIAVYPRLIKDILLAIGNFFREHPKLTALALAAVLLSCIPGIQFFLEAKGGGFVLPHRYSTSTVQSSLGVSDQGVKPWSIVEEIMYASFFTDLKKIHFKVFYMPLFFYVLALLGLWTRFNRFMAFLVLWAAILFLILTPLAAPVYRFLYDHVFFFKYFRNLHFFLWFVFVQIAVLLVAEQLRIVLVDLKARRKPTMWVIALAFAMALYFLWCVQTVLLVTWVALALGFVFFLSHLQKYRASVSWGWGLVLLAAVAIEPIQTFYYFQKNEVAYQRFQYDVPFLDFNYSRGAEMRGSFGPAGGDVYYGTQWFNLLWSKMDAEVFWEYFRHKFALYSAVEYVDPKELDVKTVEKYFSGGKHPAVVFDSRAAALNPSSSLEAFEFIGPGDKRLKVLKYSANAIRVAANFDAAKFLVYNDNFYPGWRAYVDGKPADLWQANVSFKGVWVPAGQHVVEFRFGGMKSLLQNVGLLFVFYALFVVVIYFVVREQYHEPD